MEGLLFLTATGQKVDEIRQVRQPTIVQFVVMFLFFEYAGVSSVTIAEIPIDRQESLGIYILLSDVLGLSLLVDSIDHPKPRQSTEGTVLGPFHTHEAKHMEHGEIVHKDPDGEPCLVVCTVKDTMGTPIVEARIDM